MDESDKEKGKEKERKEDVDKTTLFWVTLFATDYLSKTVDHTVMCILSCRVNPPRANSAADWVITARMNAN